MDGHYTNCTSPEGCWCECKRLSIVLFVTTVIFVVQIVGAYYSNSLALYSDAIHVLSDNAAIMVALVVATLPRWGFRKKSVQLFGSKLIVLLLFLLVVWILFEAWGRFLEPPRITSWIMVTVAFLGGIGNYMQHYILKGAPDEHKHHVHEGLSLHIISDLIQSVGVVIGGIIIWITDFSIIDPLISIAIALWILLQTIKLMRSQSAH